MLSYPEHITTCISTQQRECSPTHPKGIQKSLQNTSPRGVNAAVKSVSRLLVSSKVQNSSAIYLSIRGDVDLEEVYNSQRTMPSISKIIFEDILLIVQYVA